MRHNLAVYVPRIIHACAYPAPLHPNTTIVRETKQCKWIRADLFISSSALPWYLSLPFGARCCLVVYLYRISSFIKNSVSGAGERALRSEVDRLLGNHPPVLPSGAAPALAGSRWTPTGPPRQRGEARRDRVPARALEAELKKKKKKVPPIWWNKCGF